MPLCDTCERREGKLVHNLFVPETEYMCDECAETAYNRFQEAQASEPPLSFQETYRKAHEEKLSLKS